MVKIAIAAFASLRIPIYSITSSARATGVGALASPSASRGLSIDRQQRLVRKIRQARRGVERR
jgi:hypothetical protein